MRTVIFCLVFQKFTNLCFSFSQITNFSTDRTRLISNWEAGPESMFCYLVRWLNKSKTRRMLITNKCDNTRFDHTTKTLASRTFRFVRVHKYLCICLHHMFKMQYIVLFFNTNILNVCFVHVLQLFALVAKRTLANSKETYAMPETNRHAEHFECVASYSICLHTTEKRCWCCSSTSGIIN